jgi:glycosyltransferase involved in cell wall biosynthesis
MQAASGRVAEALAAQFDKVVMCAKVLHEYPPAPFDVPLHAPNLEVVAQPYWNSTADSLHHFFGIARAYLRTCRQVDAIFVRAMCPYTPVLYLCAKIFRKPICCWIVGDPVALLHSGPRFGASRLGLLADRFALLYALADRLFMRLGRWLTDGVLLCNGRELARIFASPRTIEIVSSTVGQSEFFSRADTCQGATVRILFVGFLRPEKGIEYLLEAVSQLNLSVPWELEITGPDEFPEYRKKLDSIAAERGIAARIRWSGYVPNGQPLWERLRAADIFVLPTLSEGTPHVLVEARANSVPCVSTSVGGVPTTVTHGYDALLVRPRDARALTRAIERLVRDGELRRSLIRNGLVAARKQTLDRFIHTVLAELHRNLPEKTAAVPQE